jgi:hypothetical protein
MPDRPGLHHTLFAAGAVLWLASFALPSVRWESLGHLQTDPGYVVARGSWVASRPP